MPYLRSPELLNGETCQLIVVDMQERLVPAMTDDVRLIDRVGFLLEAARLLEWPVSVTEQYPQGLGSTLPELSRLLVRPAVAKKRFSAVEALDLPPAAETSPALVDVILAGIESHVCLMQTALDLVALGYRVHVPVDATSSRFMVDYDIALKRLERMGVQLVTAEAIVFEVLGTSEHPQFKAISQLAKQRP